MSGQRKTDVQYKIWWYAKTKYDREQERQTLVKGTVEIDLIDFLQWLYDEGFRYTKINDNGVLFKVSSSKILEEIEVSEVRQHVVRWVQSLPEELICNSRDQELQGTINRKLLLGKIVAGVGYFFDTKKLEAYLGPRDKFTFCQDSAKDKFVFFQNGYLHINGRGIEFCDYKELPGYIWASEIIARDFMPSVLKGKNKCVVEDFFWLVASDQDLPVEEKESRFQNLRIIAGYLMHSFTRYKLKAILLTDSRMSESNEPNGRSGKTLFAKMCGGLLCPDPNKPAKTFVDIPGKNFDPSDKHRYDRASHETKLIMLNDVKRGFKTECLFNDITDGLEVNKKNQQPFMIQSKMLVISNLSIDLGGDSNQDRFCVFEFSSYFNKQHTPQKEFGQWFFEDWDDVAFSKYYLFMASCVQSFFKSGCQLPEVESQTYKSRILAEHTSREFLDFLKNDWRPVEGQWYETKAYYEKFVQIFPDYSKLPQKRFTEWIKKYMKLSGEYEPWKEDENLKRSPDGKREIRFIKMKGEQ